MKSQIISKIKVPEGYFFNSVKFISGNSIAISSYNFKEKVHLFRIFNFKEGTIIEKSVKQVDWKEQVFIEASNFGIINEKSVTIFNLIENKEYFYKIKNPLKKIEGKSFSSFVHASRLSDTKTLFTIQHTGFGGNIGGTNFARYFSILEFNNKTTLFKKVKSARWITKINQPEYKNFSPIYYNIGLFKKRPKDWLGIKSIGNNSENIYFYTNGGGSTRVKSGPKFEISEIGILDLKLNIIKVKTLETNGYGNFSSDGAFFLQQEYKNERNLILYKLSDFSYQNIRITPSKHLGNIKKHVKSDLSNNKLLLFNHSDITISYVKKLLPTISINNNG